MTGQPQTNPFLARGNIKTTSWGVTVAEATDAAQAAGYRPTHKSRPGSVHVQRDWRSAARITEVPGGVVVKGAWTTELVVAVAVVLVLLVFGLYIQGGPPSRY